MEFNNREIALSIYLGIFILWGLSKKDIRSSISNLLKIFFDGKLQILFELHLIYFLFLLIILASVDYWNYTLLKGTIYWFLFSSIALLMKAIKENKNENIFIKLIISNFQIAVLVEYISNLFVFNIYVELLLQFVLFFLFAIIAVSEKDKKYSQVNMIINGILSLFVVILISITIYNIFYNYKSVFTVQNLKEILLPVILTILYIPFIYVIAFYARIQIYFVKIDHLNKENPLNSYAKKRLLIFTHFSLKKLNNFFRRHPFIQYQNKNEIDKIFNITE